MDSQGRKPLCGDDSLNRKQEMVDILAEDKCYRQSQQEVKIGDLDYTL